MSKERPGIGETIDGDRDMHSQVDLGRPSKTKRAVRNATPPPDPAAKNMAAAAFAASISTSLNARDAKGNPIPTLAQRIAKEGFRKQLRRRGAAPAPATRKAKKPHKRKPQKEQP